ncbi:MAG: MBOAT family O-acyltransferase [Candidatus Binatia bacterium]|nr:MBOAT family O-acyltransferase [Candidatus Binatia bacterium]
MVFDSFSFLLFFAVVVAGYQLPLPWAWRKGMLLLFSYVFYAAWNPPFVLLIWISTVIDWFASRGIAGATTIGRRRAFLGLSLATNLGLLGFFKYGGFLLENFVALVQSMGGDFQPAAPNIVLPVGISFYTFQTLSYTIDVYRGQKPWPSFLDFALYVTFFPQLVAGPIVRSGEFLPQCRESRRSSDEDLGWGLSLIVVGLFFKTVLADAMLAPLADTVFADAEKAGFIAAWSGVFAFSGQIYFDFAGYSTIAIGAARCLGFTLPTNFRSPYASLGFSDFWRRWHISLSTWLRDYLYIPLGGNRRVPIRVSMNLLVTMLLGGLWHGASWLFVVWGALHGFYLMVERKIRERYPHWVEPGGLLGRALVTVGTYLLVCFAWVFFRAPDLGSALSMSSTMWTGGAGELALDRVQLELGLAATALMLIGNQLMRERTFAGTAGLLPWWGRSVVLAAMLVAIALSPGNDRAFLYFQF